MARDFRSFVSHGQQGLKWSTTYRHQFNPITFLQAGDNMSKGSAHVSHASKVNLQPTATLSASESIPTIVAAERPTLVSPQSTEASPTRLVAIQVALPPKLINRLTFPVSYQWGAWRLSVISP